MWSGFLIATDAVMLPCDQYSLYKTEKLNANHFGIISLHYIMKLYEFA